MRLVASIRKHLGAAFTLDVAVSLEPGFTMLFGASGSGKTTLLRALAGLLTPDAGSITIGQRVVFSVVPPINMPAAARGVGFVFQQLALFPHMTVADNIGYGLAGADLAVRRRRVHAIADSFQIGHVLSRRPRDVSGGERQRAALARSLVLDPTLLLLDEPLSALDHSTQSRIIDDLRAWNVSHDIPILYVTHAHREVFALGTRVLVMDDGRIVADGLPADVMDAPGREPVAQIAGFENLFDAMIVDRRPSAGTMLCRLARMGTELEVPLAHTRDESPIRLAIRAGDILLAVEKPRGLSARNVIDGRLAAIRREGPTVVADVDARDRFVVHLTPSAADGLGLAAGMPVWLIIKTYSCRVVSA